MGNLDLMVFMDAVAELFEKTVDEIYEPVNDVSSFIMLIGHTMHPNV